MRTVGVVPAWGLLVCAARALGHALAAAVVAASSRGKAGLGVGRHRQRPKREVNVCVCVEQSVPEGATRGACAEMSEDRGVLHLRHIHLLVVVAPAVARTHPHGAFAAGALSGSLLGGGGGVIRALANAQRRCRV